MASGTENSTNVADITAAICKKFGPLSKLLQFEVAKSDGSVQGLLSRITRVTVLVETPDGEEREARIVVKQKPALRSQQRLVEEMGAFEHEIGFFDRCLPLLRRECRDLPVVTCLLSNPAEGIIYLEDLDELGYAVITPSLPDLRGDVLTLEHYALIAKSLARIHGASFGTNWLEEFPDLFQFDVMFEKSALTRNSRKRAVANIVKPIAELQFAGNENILKVVEWLGSDYCIDLLKALSKPVSTGPNVLCHGDCWASNMLFKINPLSGNPVDVKFIDFQMCRYAPGSRDLLNCLYVCASFQFRQKHEKDILKIYLDAFNEICSSKNISVSWDEFYLEYNRSRIFGLMYAVALRPMIYIKGSFPTAPGAELSDEDFMKVLEGGSGVEAALRAFHDDEEFRDEIISVIKEAVEICESLVQI